MMGISNGAKFGRVAGRVTVVALVLYVVSLVYRSDGKLAAIALGVIVALYTVTSLIRDVQYGYAPWEPVEWTTVSPGDLNSEERRRALRWTVVLKLLLVVGTASGLAVIFAVGLETLGYVLLVGGLPALIVKIYNHYLDGTRPWHPSMPSRLESER